jgi:hypothetical protein
MLLQNKVPPKNKVIKWNKNRISSSEEAYNIVKFAKNSLRLYKIILGEEFIVPTEFVIGEKKDDKKIKIKVYEIQPYISGWNSKTLPEDLRSDEKLVKKWKKLYTRLSVLYIIANDVNKKARNQGKMEFPINLTLGCSRRQALSTDFKSIVTDIYNLHKQTPNLLIDRTVLDLHLCDFGHYTPWNEEMQSTYQEIYTRSLIAVNNLEEVFKL